jgi:predicted nuclease of predicted toxin-antitoxin system
VANLLADENFKAAVVAELIALGHDVITARAAGLSATPDPTVLAHATADGRVVLTHDHDYSKLHKAGVTHAGIVYCSVDRDSTALAARIHAALAATPAPAGKLIRVVKPNPPQVP